MPPNLKSYYWFGANFLGMKDGKRSVSNLNYLPIKFKLSMAFMCHLLSTACLHQCPVHPDYCYFLFSFFFQVYIPPLLLTIQADFFFHVLAGK